MIVGINVLLMGRNQGEQYLCRLARHINKRRQTLLACAHRICQLSSRPAEWADSCTHHSLPDIPTSRSNRTVRVRTDYSPISLITRVDLRGAEPPHDFVLDLHAPGDGRLAELTAIGKL